MAIPLDDNINMNAAKPTRVVDQVGTGQTYATKEDIPSYLLYDGLRTYDIDASQAWIYLGAAWVADQANIDNMLSMGYLAFDGVDGVAGVEYDATMGATDEMTNGSFEDFTGTLDGPNSSTFDGWTNHNGDGTSHLAITGEVSQVAMRLNQTGSNPAAYNYVTVKPETYYTLHFKYRGDGVHPARYGIYDETNGAYIKSLTNFSDADDTNFDNPIIYVFLTPALCTEIRFEVFNQAGQPVSHVDLDTVQIYEPYSFTAAFWVKRNEGGYIDRDYLMSRLWTDYDNDNLQRSWSVRTIGDDVPVDDPRIGALSFSMSQAGTSNSKGVVSNTILNVGEWYHVACTSEYIGGSDSIMTIYINGIVDVQETINMNPYNSIAPLTFAGLYEPTLTHCAYADMMDFVYAKRAITTDEIGQLIKGIPLSDSLIYMNATNVLSDNTTWVDAGSGGLDGLISGSVVINKRVSQKLNSGDSPSWGEIIGTLSNQTDLQSELDLKVDIHAKFKEITASNYTLIEADLGYNVEFTNPCIVTLPGTLSTGFQCILVNNSAVDVQIQSNGTYQAEGNALETQYTSCVVVHKGSDLWSAYGKLTTV